MDNKDLSMMAALAKSIGGGGSSGPAIPTPTSQDSGKVIKVDDEGAYGLALDEGQSTFAGLTDVAFTDPTDGQVPVYDETTNKWKNGSVGTAKWYRISKSGSKYNLPSGVTVGTLLTHINNGEPVYLYTSNNSGRGYVFNYVGGTFRSPEGTHAYEHYFVCLGPYNNPPDEPVRLAVYTASFTATGTSLTSITAGEYAIPYTQLPAVTSSDNGKILKVVNGVWTAVTPE